MGRFEGKVAFVTGAARGQGRSHAIALAQEGADIVAVDICRQLESVPYEMSTPEDLAETVREVEARGRRIVAREADVRDYDALNAALSEGVSELGRLDVVVVNAGITSKGQTHEISEQAWQEVIDVNLTGAWHTTKAAVPHLLRAEGGSIVITSSSSADRTYQNIGHYASTKYGVIGLMKTLALELAPQMIRANAVLPSMVATPMVLNPANYQLFGPDLVNPTIEDVMPRFLRENVLPVPWVEPIDVTNAVLFLASDEARYITGVSLPVDAGILLR
jgi:(+)-trans-carveol dehydrogenase